MFEKEEEVLKNISEKINNEAKSTDIDNYIKRGISLGKKKKRRAKIRMYTSIAALFTFIILITSIRTSPAFAYYVSKVPGFNYIVKLINYDKGIKDAVENNFVEQINASQEHDDLVFTIKDIIIDNSKALIFYSIENKGDHRFVNLHSISLKDEKGDELTFAGSGWTYFINKDMNVYKKLEENIEINFTEEAKIPEDIFISVKLKENKAEVYSEGSEEVLPFTWNFKIHIDKKKFQDMSKKYDLNTNIEIEGQKIIFKNLTITPTRMALEIEYDKNNTKKILGFDDIEIVDENGETRGIINGVSGTRVDDNNEIIYFQSNYFADPKELYIKGSSIRAIDRGKSTVEIDIENNKLLKAPDNNFILNSVTKKDKELVLKYKIIKDNIKDKNRRYNIFYGEIKDGNGKTYQEYRNNSSFNSPTENNITSYITIDNEIKSPIYLNINNYPTRINGDFKVKVK